MTGDPSEAAPTRPRWLARLVAKLSRWQRPAVHPRLLEPPVVAEELFSWHEDEGRWDPRAARDWRSLLDDVDASWARLGPKLSRAVDVADHLAALRNVRAAQALVTDDHRATVGGAALALRSAFEAPGAMRAAIDDLFEAAAASTHPDSLDDETEWRLALLASVGEHCGHEWGVIADRLRRVLEHTSSVQLEQSLEPVHRALSTPADRGHSVVWFAVDHASHWGPSSNPAVQLFPGDWLLAVLREWDGPRDDVPAELASDPRRMVDAWPRFDDGADPDEQLPVVFARVDLGDGPTVGARERARDTLELLIARASARQGGTNWRVDSACLHFVDGELIYESTGPIGNPDLYDQLTRGDITQDPTGTTINEEAERLADHLPVHNSQLHAALELSQWLTEARRAPAPARLVLSGRVIEQSANWADVSVPTLIGDHLAVAWAWDQIADDLSRAGAAAVLRLRDNSASGNDLDQETLHEVNRDLMDGRLVRGRPRARPWRTLERLDWLTSRHPVTTEIGDYLRELHERLSDGPTTAAWIAAACRELKMRNARAVRTRNVVVHGGPLNTAVAANVVGLQDALGSRALECVIEALAAGVAVPDAFAGRQARYVEALERMSGGGDPVIELSAAVLSSDAPQVEA